MADDDAPRVDPQPAPSHERTFRSWIRTSLALVATSAALVAFNLPIAIECRVASAASARGTKRRGGHVSQPGTSRLGDARVRLALVAAFAVLVACTRLLWILIQL